MRKIGLLSVLLFLLVLPLSAGAQSGEVILNEVNISIWPEYDDPGLLVFYDFSPAPGTVFPVEIGIFIPDDASLFQVAKQDENGKLINIPYGTGDATGSWQEVKLTLDNQTVYHLEYYDSLPKNGNKRTFEYTWPGNYQVNTFVVSVQEPTETSAFSSTPPLPNVGALFNGLKQYSGTFGSLAKDEKWSLQVSYERSTDALSIEGQPIQGSDIQPTATKPFSDYLPFIMGGFAILLIAVGLVWFWQSGRQTTTSKQGRKRHTVSSQPASGGQGQVYCHECGKRAQQNDKFCRACGAKLRL